ncbi:MAG TPA: MFS transporter [Acidimicrobiia bacterium]|nr:MFS transporter [Acidimicrobiia bacterium]
MTAPPQPLRLGTSEGRWVVATTVMGTGVAMLNGTDVSVALPALGADLDASVAALQWVLNGYMLTLASLILVGGSLADRYGRRRIYLLGVAWFTAASVLCALAPSPGWLVAARILQGVGGALLTPGSLAILQSCFHPDDRSTAIGAWSGLTGIAAVIGPVVGGLLVDGFGWRAVFFLPLPLAVAVIWAGSRHVPESRDPAPPRLDWPGALLTVAGLGTLSYAIIAYPEAGWAPTVVTSGILGLVFLAGFVVRERVADDPMLPLSVFGSRQFTAANLITFVVYAALGGVFFMLIVHLQTVVGYSATGAGAATMPVSALLLVGSPPMGRVMQRIGPRLPLTVGNALLAAGMLMMISIGEGSSYLTGVLPPLVVFGIGLTLMVTPVTATVLSAIEDRFSGLASGVNNAVARTGQLLAVAALPAAAGLTGGDFADPVAFAAGFRVAMIVSAVLCALGAVLAWTMITNPEPET